MWDIPIRSRPPTDEEIAQAAEYRRELAAEKNETEKRHLRENCLDMALNRAELQTTDAVLDAAQKYYDWLTMKESDNG